MHVFALEFHSGNEQVRFDCAGASGLRLRPLILCRCASIFDFSFALSFYRFLGHPWELVSWGRPRSAAEAGPIQAHSDSALMQQCSLRSGASPCSPQDHFENPRPDLRRLLGLRSEGSGFVDRVFVCVCLCAFVRLFVCFCGSLVICGTLPYVTNTAGDRFVPSL